MSFLSLTLLALLGLTQAALVEDETLDQVWTSFKAMHSKKYAVDEEHVRRQIFEKNVQYIARHNLEHDLGLHSYTLGINQFADMTNEEFRATYLRPLERVPTELVASTFLAPEGLALPDSVDWRDKGYVTGVKNQGQCGSCWSFSTTGSLEGQWFRKTGSLISLSEQQLVDCSAKYGNQGCNGGLMDQAFQYIHDFGIETEEVYPYTARDGTCKYDKSKTVATVTGFTDVKNGSESDLQAAVATVGPVSVAIDAGHISFQLYRGGVYDPIICSSTNLDHGVLAVGYGTQDSKDFWIVKNSWGNTWGLKGYILMVRNNNNKCGIATSASYPLV